MLVIVLDGGDSKQMTIQYNTMTIQLRSNTQLYSYLHIHNVAARFVTGARRHDHMTPVLREWHWLPARQRKRFKTAVMVYKCIHGLAPSYLASHCKPTSSALVGPICDPPRLANSTFLARRLTMGREFRCQWTSCLEQLTYWTSVTWHLAGRFQSQAEDISV